MMNIFLYFFSPLNNIMHFGVGAYYGAKHRGIILISDINPGAWPPVIAAPFYSCIPYVNQFFIRNENSIMLAVNSRQLAEISLFRKSFRLLESYFRPLPGCLFILKCLGLIGVTVAEVKCCVGYC